MKLNIPHTFVKKWTMFVLWQCLNCPDCHCLLSAPNSHRFWLFFRKKLISQSGKALNALGPWDDNLRLMACQSGLTAEWLLHSDIIPGKSLSANQRVTGSRQIGYDRPCVTSSTNQHLIWSHTNLFAAEKYIAKKFTKANIKLHNFSFININNTFVVPIMC